jgi:hypothetical protein
MLAGSVRRYLDTSDAHWEEAVTALTDQDVYFEEITVDERGGGRDAVGAFVDGFAATLSPDGHLARVSGFVSDVLRAAEWPGFGTQHRESPSLPATTRPLTI